ncbi:unnamed protein product [Auanema sp. JU1783]|nr:unnamed protein product [Auanema sp. JU1783]
MKSLLILFTSISIALCSAADNTLFICKNSDGLTIATDSSADALCKKKEAKALYRNEINETGWAYLEMSILDKQMDMLDQGYVMGYTEGRLTQKLITYHINNMIKPYCKGNKEYCNKLFAYLETNFNWTMNQIKQNPSSTYWKQVHMTIRQIQGIIDGYSGIISEKLPSKDIVRHPIYMLQWLGDFMDLEKKFDKKDGPIKTGKTHCSAIVKLLPDFSDILFSHVTWFTYASMTRIQKKYSFALDIPGHTYSFSGYPGTVNSIDDFLISSAKLAILETTIELHNEKLYKFMIPESLPTYLRTQIATRAANNGSTWVQTFSKYNSGTYNNQFVVLDYKLFKKGERTQTLGLLTVMEQMPSHIARADKSHQLFETTYWPSYNRAYFPDIFNISGATHMVQQFGDWYSYDHAPRANIFRRDHHFVVDLVTLIKLMRSNNYKTDEFSHCHECDPPYSAESAISARGDLNDPDGFYPIADRGFLDMGATDVKVTNAELMEKFQFAAISGPTNYPTPVFNWNTSLFRDTVAHEGQPTVWRFPTVTHEWQFSRDDVDSKPSEEPRMEGFLAHAYRVFNPLINFFYCYKTC